MRDATFRWGLGMGLASAALGVFALLVGAFFFPIPVASTADSVAVAILIRGLLALLALGVTLGLAYYAGLQVERDRIRHLLEASEATTALGASAQDRIGSLIAGLLVTFCWWFGTTLTGYLLPLLPETKSSAADPSQFALHLIWGGFIVVIGAGLGGLGSRMVAARTLLDRIMVSPQTTTIPLAASFSVKESAVDQAGAEQDGIEADSISSSADQPGELK
jgi:hypothetical protein